MRLYLNTLMFPQFLELMNVMTMTGHCCYCCLWWQGNKEIKSNIKHKSQSYNTYGNMCNKYWKAIEINDMSVMCKPKIYIERQGFFFELKGISFELKSETFRK